MSKGMLVIDESSKNRELIGKIFSYEYKIFNASKSKEALNTLYENSNDISAVLIDFDAAQTDGFDVLRTIKSNNKYLAIPVIAILTFDSDETEIRALKLGADDIVTKPIRPDIIRQRVRNAVERYDRERIRLKYQMIKEQSSAQLQLNALINNIPGGIAIIKYGENITPLYFNDTLSELAGYSHDEFEALTSEDVLSVICKEDIKVLYSAFHDSVGVKGNISCDFRFVNKEKKESFVRFKASNIGSVDDGRLYYCVFIDINREKQQEAATNRALKELKYRAEYDNLTGIYNRESFYIYTKEMLENNPDEEYVILCWDIERFKLINDIFGKAVGDKMLKKTADFFASLVGSYGTYGRLEADHFAICIKKSLLNVEELDDLATKMLINNEVKRPVTFAIGIYDIEDKAIPVDQMCDRANIALKTIKGNFNTHYAFYDEKLRNEMLEEQGIHDDMEHALKHRDFIVFLQPIYSISKGIAISAEALVRWAHPQKGFISPAQFIPTFEKTGFIAKLDYYVWEEVCRYLKNRKDRGLRQIPISVNASRRSLYTLDICDMLLKLTKKYEIEHSLLKVEITETAYSDNPVRLLKIISLLQSNGFKVLMDDFGSGYSSLNTLKDIPVDILKVDMKFLEGFENGGRVGTILTSILRMARWLNIPVVSEGVETTSQVEFLKSIGCDWIQGFCYSRPLPIDDFEKKVEAIKVEADSDDKNDFSQSDIDLLLGGNSIINKIIESMFGGFGIYEFSFSEEAMEAIRVNAGYYNIMGYTAENFNTDARNVLEKVYFEDVCKVKNACHEAVKTEKSIHFVIRRHHSDGHIMYLDSICRHLGGYNDKMLFCITFSDITSQVEQE